MFSFHTHEVLSSIHKVHSDFWEEMLDKLYQEGGSETQFKPAVLELSVTPSIIGDGNVLLDVSVNNDSVNRATGGEPSVNTMKIKSKLLVADGDIVVIGGIKKNKVFDTKAQLPGIGNVPILGNLFKGTTKSDNLDELLIFIAPRVL